MELSKVTRSYAYTFGSDPEVFALGKDGNIKPAFTFLPDKDKPLEIHSNSSGRNFAIYNDGFQAEVKAVPAACIAYVVDSIREGLKKIWEESKGGKLTIDNCPMIPIKTLRETPDAYVILGCDPSLNAYHMAGKAVDNPRTLRHRFTGFHIHASGFNTMPQAIEKRGEFFQPYVQMLDKVLAIFFVAAGAHLESAKRREYYGLAGEYRLPPHGLEYRVLSSVVLSHPAITNLAFDLARSTMSLVDCKAEKLWVADLDETIGVINANDQKAARALIKRNADLFNHLIGLSWVFTNTKTMKAAYDVAMNGIDSLVKDPNDFVKNWKFYSDWEGHAEGENEGWRTLICGR